MEIDYQAMGKRIKAARLAMNMTQEKLAEAINISLPHISNIENGHSKVSLATLLQIANALNTSLDQLVCDSLKNALPIFLEEANHIFADCTITETKILVDVLRATKDSLKRNR